MWVAMETTCCHSNQKISIIWLVLAIMITFRRLLLEGNICYSVSNPLTRAAREGQGPSTKYTMYVTFAIKC